MKNFKNFLYAQTAVLVGGTAFAWYNWVEEYFFDCKSCSTNGEFFSKCFFGAVFFTIALILNIVVIVLTSKKTEISENK